MGYTYRNNGNIKDYWPDKMGIASEYIHTSCLTYDKYDPFDWNCFIHITREK